MAKKWFSRGDLIAKFSTNAGKIDNALDLLVNNGSITETEFKPTKGIILKYYECTQSFYMAKDNLVRNIYRFIRDSPAGKTHDEIIAKFNNANMRKLNMMLTKYENLKAIESGNFFIRYPDGLGDIGTFYAPKHKFCAGA